MSCHVLQVEDLSILASFICKVLNHGFNYFGFEGNELLNSSLIESYENCYFKESKVFKTLYEMNERAYNIRYKESNLSNLDMVKYKELDITKPSKWENQHYVAEQWHYQAYKLIQSYIYQCSEDISIQKSELYRGLKELYITLGNFIVQNSEEYQKAKWA